MFAHGAHVGPFRWLGDFLVLWGHLVEPVLWIFALGLILVLCLIVALSLRR